MARKLSIFRYIALNNPQAANELVRSYGAPKITSEKQLIATLKKVAQKNDNKEFVNKILDIHPDKRLFESKQMNIEPVVDFSIDAEPTITEKLATQTKDTRVTNIAIGALIGLGITVTIVGLIKMVK